MQVDDVRHHGRAQDARREEHRVGPREARDEAARCLAGVEADLQRVVEEAEQDDAEQPRHDDLETPVALSLHPEDRERHDRGDHPGREQRDAEEQVQRDRRADELGEVRRHRDQLGLDPQAPGHRPPEVLTA